MLHCLKSTLGGVTRNPESKLKNLRPSAAQGDSFLGSCGPSELEDQVFLLGTKRAYHAIPPQPPARSIRPVPRPELQGAMRNQLQQLETGRAGHRGRKRKKKKIPKLPIPNEPAYQKL